MTKRELGISAAVLAVMISAELKADAAEGAGAEDAKPRVVRVESRRIAGKVAEHAFEIAREAMPDDPAPIAREVRIVPFFRDGKAEGMKLYAIREGSPLLHAGFRNGDVVRVVGGIAVTTPEACLEAWERVRGLDSFDVELERAGEPITLHYEVR